MLIGGEWVENPEKIQVVNPYTGETVGEVSRAHPQQVLEATRLAKSYVSDLSAYERAEILASTAGDIEESSADFVSSICGESGLCRKDGEREVKRAVTLLRVCAEESKRILGESIFTDITDAKSKNIVFTVREPVGLVCAITPFNRPLNQVVVKLAPAIAANNSVILKPSEKTPLTAIKFVQTLIDNGLPQEMVSVVTGQPGEIGDALVQSPYIDMLTFTGSRKVGETIARRVGMIKTVFELGDSGALVVLEDGDVDKAVRAAVVGAFGTAGQSCRGVKRILVQESVADRFVGELQQATAKLNLGDPMASETDIGSLISEEAAMEVERRVEAALDEGANLVYGGNRNGAQYSPTILDWVKRDSDLVKTETFGPIAPVIRVQDMDDAVNYVNDTEYGLQAGVFTNDISKALFAIRKLKVGAVIINDGPQFDSPNIPFGGVKKSGMGREGAKYSIQEMTVVKTIVL